MSLTIPIDGYSIEENANARNSKNHIAAFLTDENG
jgi:hypothetical protein